MNVQTNLPRFKKVLIYFELIFLIVLCSSASIGAQCHADDYAALRALYLAMDGDDWSDNDGWETIRDNATPPASCDLSILDGISLNAAGRVDSLDLSFDNDAPLPPEFALLTELRECHLDDYFVESTFPTILLGFSKLEVLSWTGAVELSGILPANITDLTNLETLIIKDGNLKSPLPDMSSMPLKHLDLSENKFDEIIPMWIWNLATLEVLDLANCRFKGGIPDEIENMVALKELILYFNMLHGTISPKIGSLVNLEILFISDNDLYGLLPKEIGTMPNIEKIYLNRNQFSGSVPKEWASLTSLTDLTLHGNRLSGCFHADLSLLDSAISRSNNIDFDNNFDATWDNFIVSQAGQCDCDQNDWIGLRAIYNELDGDNWNPVVSTNWDTVHNNVTMPVGFDKSSLIGIGINAEGCVDSIRIRNRNLTGVLPDELRSISALRVLNLSKNNISGTLPDSLGGLPYLEDLRLHENALTGSIYTDGFASLKILSLNDNNLSGEIPTTISQLNLLEQLWVGDNGLAGTLPPGLAELEHLHTLKLENAGLSGCFLPSLSALCPQLTDVSIDIGNSFEETWANYCSSGLGSCADCSNHYVEWEGRYDDDWTKDYNWSTYCVPTLMDTVVIDNSAEVVIPFLSSAYAAQLGIEVNNKLSVGSDAILNVQGGGNVLISNNGTLETSGGSILLIGGPSYSLVNTGTVDIQSFGLLEVSNGGGIGIYNTAVLDNEGTIRIRDMYANAGEDHVGFLNWGDSAVFNNDRNVEISNVYDVGFYNGIDAKATNGIIDKIIIDGVYNGGGLIQAALLNTGDFITEGTVEISNYAETGLHNLNTFENDRTIRINTVPGNGIGVLNEGLFTNLDNLYIDQEEASIIPPHSGLLNKGVFLNRDRIQMNANNYNFVAIHNEHIFINAEDSTGAGNPNIYINGGAIGIENEGVFENTNELTILNFEMGFSNAKGGDVLPVKDNETDILKMISEPAQFNNYTNGDLEIDSCDLGILNTGELLNEGNIHMSDNTQAIQNGDESLREALVSSDEKNVQKSLSSNTDAATITNTNNIDISGGESGIVNECNFYNERDISIDGVKFVGFYNLDTFHNGARAFLTIENGGYNKFENPDSLPPPDLVSMGFLNGETSPSATSIVATAHNEGFIEISNWDNDGIYNSGVLYNDSSIDVEYSAGGLVNIGSVYNHSGSRIDIEEIHGYLPFGLGSYNTPNNRNGNAQFVNEGDVTISNVSVTSILPNATDEYFGLGMFNSLSFVNKEQGHLHINDCEAGLINVGVLNNEHSSGSIIISEISNDSMRYALLNESPGSIMNYGHFEIVDVDHDGLSNEGSIYNYANANFKLQSIMGDSWLQRSGGYLHNEQGSILEIQYPALKGSPLVVDPGGLIDGYSEILIVEEDQENQ